jgi:FolB domain-containing protein
MPTQALADLFVEGLGVVCIIGDLPHERSEPQQIILNLQATLDIQKAARSDLLSDSLNYISLANLAIEVAQQGQFHLVEALVVAIANASFSRFPQMASLDIRLEKFGCHPQAKTCGIRYKAFPQAS